MKPTITDETVACLMQLSADIAELREILEYIEPVQNRLTTLINELERVKQHDRHKPNTQKGYADR